MGSIRTTASTLCKICAALFEGEWKQRSEITEDSVDGGNTEGLRDHHHADIAKDPEDEDKPLDYGESDFCERSEWLQRVEQSSGFTSPAHYSIPGLEASAARGCHLCNLLLNALPTAYTGHENQDSKIWELAKQKSARLIGIATVRPDHGQEEALGIICLEISYFVDGNFQSSDCYFCTVEFQLLPIPGKWNETFHQR